MLVFISDLHLTDGSSGTTLGADAFRILRKHVGNIAYAASHRKGGAYQPLDRLDIILLGDIFDVIRSTQWLQDDVRPWSGREGGAGAKKVEDRVHQITDGIFVENAKSLAVLKSMVAEKVVVPAAHTDDADTREEAIAKHGSTKVDVGIHYQIGNHDWFYGMKEDAYSAMREDMCAAAGLSNDYTKPFPHEPVDCPNLTALYDAHGVYAAHGDKYDAINCMGGRCESSLGDGIVTDVLSSFHYEVEQKLRGELPGSFVDELREIDNVRPLLHTPLWLRGLMARCELGLKQMERVKAVWDRLAKRYITSEFVASHDKLLDPWDAADKVQTALFFSRSMSLDALGWLGFQAQGAKWVDRLIPTRPAHAEAEKETTPSREPARYVLYGHTHDHVMTPLEGAEAATGPARRMYINTGTWRRTHRLATEQRRGAAFAAYDVMTYAIIYKEDERKGRGFETWSGSLGPEPA